MRIKASGSQRQTGKRDELVEELGKEKQRLREYFAKYLIFALSNVFFFLLEQKPNLLSDSQTCAEHDVCGVSTQRKPVPQPALLSLHTCSLPLIMINIVI